MKINLLIDSNNFLNKVLFGLQKYSDRKRSIPGYIAPKFSQTEHIPNDEVEDLFFEKIGIDFNYLLKDVPTPDNIFFLKDAKSWRKKVLINGEMSYKSSRKKKLQEKNIDWNRFDNTLNKFLEENSDIIPIKIDGLEADDLVYLLNEQLIEENPNCLNIIMSTDGDFNQLLGYNTIIYNYLHTNPRFLISSKYELLEYKNMARGSLFENKSKNPFDMSNTNFTGKLMDSKDIFESIQNNFSIESEDPELSIFTKVLYGDPKDDVPNIYYWEHTNSKGDLVTTKVTPKFYNKIIEYYKSHDISISMDNFLTKENAKLLKILIETYTKKEVDLKLLATNLKRNRLLLYLSKNTIPEKLVEKFSNEFESFKDKLNLS
jgi:hypothetical protein